MMCNGYIAYVINKKPSIDTTITAHACRLCSCRRHARSSHTKPTSGSTSQYQPNENASAVQLGTAPCIA